MASISEPGPPVIDHDDPIAFRMLNSKASLQRSKTVLIVDDDRLSRSLFHDVFDSRGFMVLLADRGARACALAEVCRPDLILLDMRLPDMSGLDIAVWMRSKDELKSIPILAVTAYALNGDQERILRVSCDAYLAKPVSLNDLFRAARTLLGEN